MAKLITLLLRCLLLSLLFLNSVLADYVVYPRVRSNLRLNADITNTIVSLLGAQNVQTFISDPRQVYEFWLVIATDDEARTVRKVVGVEEILENSIVAVNCGEISGDASLGIQSSNETSSNKPVTVRQVNAPQDLDLVSWPPKKNWVEKMPGYDYEATAGLYTYVYVIDNGINMLNTEFEKMLFHPIEWHFAPSVSKLTGDESNRGHGSCTASKATGWISGVSKNSHLIVMKSSLTMADIHYSFFTALDDIISNNRKRESVILFPHTSTTRYGRSSLVPKNWAAIKELIQEAFDNDVPVVVPAGNGGGGTDPRAIDTVPALWGIRGSHSAGTKPFPLIVAGSVTRKGQFADFSQGKLDSRQIVWAPGVEVKCASAEGDGAGAVTGSGTSFSAGMVAGLVAYMMTGTDPAPGTMALTMRVKLLKSARMISPFSGPDVIWNGLNGRMGLERGNVSVSIL